MFRNHHEKEYQRTKELKCLVFEVQRLELKSAEMRAPADSMRLLSEVLHKRDMGTMY